MLNSLNVLNAQGQLLELPFWDASNGYSVKGIDGLDPVKASIVTSSFASMDGEQYQASRREKRNILIQLGMEAGYSGTSVRELRNYLYNFFMPKTEANFSFYDSDGDSVYLINGRIESFEAPLFAKEPNAMISILCFDPDFYAPSPEVFSGNTVSSPTENILSYEGSSPTGVEFQLNLNRNISEFVFQQVSGDTFLRSMDIKYDFLSGDVVKISTIPGAKSVILNRAGLEQSILYAMTTESTWVYLQPGDNDIQVRTEGAAIPYTMVYTTKFGGL